jgi:hypothetical protein
VTESRLALPKSWGDPTRRLAWQTATRLKRFAPSLFDGVQSNISSLCYLIGSV